MTSLSRLQRIRKMGSRCALIDYINFEFTEGGQQYLNIGTLSSNPNVVVLYQNATRVKAPLFSHTPGRVYAIAKNGELKHLAYFDEQHHQAVCIDFCHPHKKVMPHKHIYMNHDKNAPGIPPNDEELKLANKIKKKFNLK